jgi:hypothetical protein
VIKIKKEDPNTPSQPHSDESTLSGPGARGVVKVVRNDEGI